MGIFIPMIFYKEEKIYLKEILEKQPGWWVRDNILKKLEEDEIRQKEISDCKHKYGNYTGHKTCCVHCGYYDQDMGFTWELDTPSQVDKT